MTTNSLLIEAWKATGAADEAALAYETHPVCHATARILAERLAVAEWQKDEAQQYFIAAYAAYNTAEEQRIKAATALKAIITALGPKAHDSGCAGCTYEIEDALAIARDALKQESSNGNPRKLSG